MQGPRPYLLNHDYSSLGVQLMLCCHLRIDHYTSMILSDSPAIISYDW